jgi:hypothetical protein
MLAYISLSLDASVTHLSKAVVTCILERLKHVQETFKNWLFGRGREEAPAPRGHLVKVYWLSQRDDPSRFSVL